MSVGVYVVDVEHIGPPMTVAVLQFRPCDVCRVVVRSVQGVQEERAEQQEDEAVDWGEPEANAKETFGSWSIFSAHWTIQELVGFVTVRDSD